MGFIVFFDFRFSIFEVMSHDSMLRRYEAGSSGALSEDEDEFDEKYMEHTHDSYQAPGPSTESMVQSSLHCRKPWPDLKPLKFTPQVSFL